jgi:hypothetical protein
MLNKEEIVPVPGYEQYYGASRNGRVFSFNYRRTGKTKELAQSELTDIRRNSETKYKRAKMYFINKNTPIAIHRIIALTFVKNPNNYKLVNHIDGNKGHNDSYNLEWCNNSQNQKHAFDNNLHIYPVGENHHMHKLTENEALEIKNQLSKSKYIGQLGDLAKKYNVSKHCIFDIRRGRSWEHL